MSDYARDRMLAALADGLRHKHPGAVVEILLDAFDDDTVGDDPPTPSGDESHRVPGGVSKADAA